MGQEQGMATGRARERSSSWVATKVGLSQGCQAPSLWAGGTSVTYSSADGGSLSSALTTTLQALLSVQIWEGLMGLL